MKRERSKYSQRGISFFGLLILGVVLALLAIVGARVVPTVTEFIAIQKTAKRVAAAGGDSPLAIRRQFDLAAAADYISSISGKDLEVTKSGSNVVINFAYDKEIPLAGPAYLLIKYRGSSDPNFN